MAATREILPSERSAAPDPRSGRMVVRWTASPAKDQHLYFTGPSVTADGRWLVIISERDGHPNLWAIDRGGDGRIHRLTANARGSRLAYCYPWGGPCGLSKPTPCLDAVRRRVYAVIDDRAVRIDLDGGGQRDLGPLPAGWMPSFGQLSPDGTTWCLPLSDPDALVDSPSAPDQGTQMAQVWARVERGLVRSRLLLIDTATGAQRIAAEVPFWVTHVNWDPVLPGRMIFNSEGDWRHQGTIPRMWLLDPDGGFRPFFQQPAGERLGHENWAPDGASVVYHGVDERGHFLARRASAGELRERRDLDGLTIHHATLLPDGATYLIDTADDGWLYAIAPGREPLLLCRAAVRNRADQDPHAHALAGPDGWATFTSDAASPADVYEVDLRGAP